MLPVSPIPKFQSILLYGQQFLRYPCRPLRDKGPYIAHMYYQCSRVSNFSLFHSTVNHFKLQGILRKMHRMTQNDLEPYKVKCTSYMCYYQYSRDPHFTPFRSTTRSIRDNGHFEASAPNDRNMTLITSSNVAHMYCQCPPSLKLRAVSRRFALWPVVFELQAIWDNGMTPNDLGHYKVKGTSYTCYQSSRVPVFTPRHHTTSRFRVTGHFATCAMKDPK